MKAIEFLSEIEITLTGGFAIYGILCMLFVFIVGFTYGLRWMIKNLP